MSSSPAPVGNTLIYQNERGDTRVDVYFVEDTIWMTQRTMAELYQLAPQGISVHIRNIYRESELLPEATCKNFIQVQAEGDVRYSERQSSTTWT